MWIGKATPTKTLMSVTISLESLLEYFFLIKTMTANQNPPDFKDWEFKTADGKAAAHAYYNQKVIFTVIVLGVNGPLG